MSANTIEKALWQAVTNPVAAQRLRDDAQAYLDECRVTADESKLVIGWDVKAMARLGVSDLLLMMAFSTINGHDKMPEYAQKINAPSA